MPQNKIFFIYKVTNKIDQKIYIGATTATLEARKNDHISKSKGAKKTKFQEAIGTFGPDAFTWEIIDSTTTIDDLASKERFYIDKYNSKDDGYNEDVGGGFKKKVYKFDEIYGLIGIYPSLSVAALTVFGKKNSVSNTCLGQNKSYRGYYWSYKEDFQFPLDDRKKAVIQYNLEGDLIAKFDSVAQACEASGLSKSSISRVCRYERKQAGGYCWKYLELRQNGNFV